MLRQVHGDLQDARFLRTSLRIPIALPLRETRRNFLEHGRIGRLTDKTDGCLCLRCTDDEGEMKIHGHRLSSP